MNIVSQLFPPEFTIGPDLNFFGSQKYLFLLRSAYSSLQRKTTLKARTLRKLCTLGKLGSSRNSEILGS